MQPVSAPKDVEELVNQLIGEPKPSTISRTSTFVNEVEDQPEEARPIEKVVELTMNEVSIVEVLPDAPEVYNKEIQTDFVDEEDTTPTESLPEVQEQPIKTPSPPVAPQEVINASTELSETDKDLLLSSDSFMSFFDKSTRIVERALNEEYDVLVDYTADNIKVNENQTEDISLYRHFVSDKLTRNRCVTSLDWSSRFPELLLGSYNKNTSNVNSSDGLALVWNLHLPDRPEFTLYSQSDVTVAKFSPFHNTIIVGSTYSGQILIWDTRTKSMPVLSSTLSSAGHSHPISSFAFVGTANSHTLISASTDGVVCSWQLDMLAHPEALIELSLLSGKTYEVAVTEIGFQKTEANTFWVGCEEGNVYQVNRFDSAGSKAGIDHNIVYTGHETSITGLHFNPFFENQNLFLTSSLDWTVKLWKSQTSKLTGYTKIEPLKSFDEFHDYVADVKWSPKNSAIFSTIDASGSLDLYNLNSPETPFASLSSAGGSNRIGWSHEGNYIATAGFDGSISVYDASKALAPLTDGHLPSDYGDFQ